MSILDSETRYDMRTKLQRPSEVKKGQFRETRRAVSQQRLSGRLSQSVLAKRESLRTGNECLIS